MSEGKGRGRPRGEGTDERILQAAWNLMSQVGYTRMSVEAVAAEAGVTKPTVYLRFPSKERLATAAVAAAFDRMEPTPDSGDTRADLITQLQRFWVMSMRPYGVSLTGTVLAEEHETPELLEHFRQDIVHPRRALFRTILERAEARGELRPGADMDLAVNLLVGAFYAQYLEGRPFHDAWAEHVVALACDGLLLPESDEVEGD